jgi:hypothetical protein
MKRALQRVVKFVWLEQWHVGMPNRKPYSTDVSDREWLRRPYLTLVRQDAPQRVHEVVQVFNALKGGS